MLTPEELKTLFIKDLKRYTKDLEKTFKTCPEADVYSEVQKHAHKISHVSDNFCSSFCTSICLEEMIEDLPLEQDSEHD